VRLIARVLLIAAAVCSARPGSSGLLTGHIFVDGVDVTGNISALLVFVPKGRGLQADATPVTCEVGVACSVPEGTYEISLRSDEVVLLHRPTVIADPPDASRPPQVFGLEAVRAAQLTCEDPLLAEYRIDALDIGAGTLFQKILRKGSTSLRVSARPLVISVKDARGRSLGFFKLQPGSGERVPLAIPPSPAKGRGQLFCGFLFPKPSEKGGYRDFGARLISGDVAVPPSLVITADLWRYYAFWLDAPAGPFRIETGAKDWTSSWPVTGEIPDRGSVSLPEIPVIQKPSLKVSFQPTARVPAGQLQIELLDCRRSADIVGPLRLSLCKETSVQSGALETEFRFLNMEPSLYALRWRLGPFSSVASIDMRSGETREERIPIQIYEMTGKVTRGEDPVAATLRWRSWLTDDLFRAEANAVGEYRVLLSQLDSFTVLIDGDDFVDFADHVYVRGDGQQDFRIPRNRFRVHIVDSKNGGPIVRAAVHWGLKVKDSTMARAAQVETDVDGNADLPPLQAGAISFFVTADGYRASSRVEVSVDSGASGGDQTIALERGVEFRVRVEDPVGRPIQGATVSWGDGLVSNPAGLDGVITIDEPLTSGQPLSVFSSSGQVGVFRWSGDEDSAFRMPAPGEPFTVEFQTPDGKPVGTLMARYAINGIPIAAPFDYLARQQSGGDINSRKDGTLRIAGLPRDGVVSVWPAGRPDLALTRPLPIRERLLLTVPTSRF
jgi:hypothetical protein